MKYVVILWEKYLVYATVFGIADRVLEQLKIVYPEMLDENYMLAHNYTYLYFMAHSPNTSLFSSINNCAFSCKYLVSLYLSLLI